MEERVVSFLAEDSLNSSGPHSGALQNNGCSFLSPSTDDTGSSSSYFLDSRSKNTSDNTRSLSMSSWSKDSNCAADFESALSTSTPTDRVSSSSSSFCDGTTSPATHDIKIQSEPVSFSVISSKGSFVGESLEKASEIIGPVKVPITHPSAAANFKEENQENSIRTSSNSSSIAKDTITIDIAKRPIEIIQPVTMEVTSADTSQSQQVIANPRRASLSEIAGMRLYEKAIQRQKRLNCRRQTAVVEEMSRCKLCIMTRDTKYSRNISKKRDESPISPNSVFDRLYESRKTLCAAQMSKVEALKEKKSMKQVRVQNHHDKQGHHTYKSLDKSQVLADDVNQKMIGLYSYLRQHKIDSQNCIQRQISIHARPVEDNLNAEFHRSMKRLLHFKKELIKHKKVLASLETLGAEIYDAVETADVSQGANSKQSSPTEKPVHVASEQEYTSLFSPDSDDETLLKSFSSSKCPAGLSPRLFQDGGRQEDKIIIE